MITKVIDAVVAGLKLQTAFSGKTVTPNYDQSISLDDANGIIAAVNGSSDVAVAGPGGRPIAWTCNITVTICSHRVEDKNGAVRKTLVEAAHDFFMSLSSLTITGYALDAVHSVRESETSVIGENYIALQCMAALMISKTT